MESSYNEWLDSLEFYEDDLKLLRTTLADVSVLNPDAEIQNQIKHYQRQFDLQQQHISELADRIKSCQREQEIELHFKPDNATTAVTDRFPVLESDMISMQKTFEELRNECNLFFKKVM